MPLGFFRRRPVSVVRSSSVSSGCARLGHPRTAVSVAFPACRVSRNSLKNLFFDAEPQRARSRRVLAPGDLMDDNSLRLADLCGSPHLGVKKTQIRDAKTCI